MGNPPAFQTYASDYYVDTNSWRVEEIGIYQRLLLTEWVNGGLPSDEERLARIAGCSIKKFQKGWITIKIKFHLNGNGLFINDRMELVREEQLKYKELQSNKAKLRWKPKIADGLAESMPKHEPKVCSSSSSSLLINNNRDSKSSQIDAKPKRWYKNEQGNYVCFQCQKSYMQYQTLQDHFKNHKGD